MGVRAAVVEDDDGEALKYGIGRRLELRHVGQNDAAAREASDEGQRRRDWRARLKATPRPSMTPSAGGAR